MKTIGAFVKRRPVLSCFALAFGISWGVILIVVGGPGGIVGTGATNSGRSPTSAESLLVFLAMFAGSGVAGILLTATLDGRAGLRRLFSRMVRWRVDARWYAAALLTIPLLATAVLSALSLISPDFVPGIATTNDMATLLLLGVVAGLLAGFFEEMGWTGFAVPRLLARHAILATGLIVGVLWGAWHFLVYLYGGATSSGTLPPALYLLLQLSAWWPAYRVLMVWVYDRTESLLVAMLMHASLTASLSILVPPTLAGVPLVIWDLVLAAVLWAVVGVVALANHGHLSRQASATQAGGLKEG